MQDIHCYAQRLLNPFRGMLHIIAYTSAEAVTTDGEHWDIYVRNDELVKDLENSSQVQTSDIRYGSWSEQKGLKRGPVFPSKDFQRMEEMGAVVYEHLRNLHRQGAGEGIGMTGINLPRGMEGRRLANKEFPPYLMQAKGHDEQHVMLVDEFFQWQAPWLLLLPGLQDNERRVLEQQARSRALVVDKQFRLYPKVIDQELFNAARVEAMLRKGQQTEDNPEDVMSTFYIELHPSPTE